MSNVTLFNPKANLPAYVKRGELSSMAKALAGGGGIGKRVSIKGGVFRLIAEGKEIAAVEERYLDVVLVNAAPKISRTFYMTTYDPENPAPPDCWSADGDAPDASVPAETRQASRCADCAKNVKGSGQGDSRACRYQQRLAVVLANDIEGDVLQLTAPATSVFGKEEGENRPLQAYARWLAAQNVNPEQVVTRMKFDTTSESPKLFFKPMRWLTEDEYDVVLEKAQSPDAIKAITLTVAQQDGVKALAKLEGTPPKAKVKEAAAAPADADDEPPAPPPKAANKGGRPKKVEVAADDDDEPVVREKEKPATTVPLKGKLAEVAAAWDD